MGKFRGNRNFFSRDSKLANQVEAQPASHLLQVSQRMVMSELEEKMASRLALGAAKKELRLWMKNELSKVAPESVNTQSASVCSQISQLPQYKKAKRIGIYLSMPAAEIQTDEIVRDALHNGKKVFVPYLGKHSNASPDTPKSVMDMVDLRSLQDYTSLKRDNWGIPTIGKDTVSEREGILGYWTGNISNEGLDMILLPGVAFDVDSEDGRIRRLGHGKGFYDYFMHKYLESKRGSDTTKVPGTDVLLYGLALQQQFLQPEAGKLVPVGEWDHRLHGLVVGDGEIVEGPLNT